MPRRALRPCGTPGCPELARGRWCERHARQARRAYDQARGTAAQRGYDARWRRLRRMVLARQPLCADPFGVHAEAGEIVAATEVDHIVPKRAGGRDRLDNLQALCKPCHSRKTAGEVGFAGEGGGKSL